MLHPLVVALLAADLTAALLLASATYSAGRILVGWQGGAATDEQLALERRAEGVSIRGRAGALTFLAASFLLVLAIASVLPGIVRGAMCGTGVLQAMGPSGPRVLAFQGLALFALAAWHLVDGLNRGHPRAPLTTVAARALLLSFPIVLLALIETARSLLALEVEQPVDCCSAVFDAVREQSSTDRGRSINWLYPMGGGAVVIVSLGLFLFFARARGRGAVAWILAVTTLFWIPTAAVALVRHLVSYHYGVLAHDCPFCLFAWRHGLLGYPIFGLLLIVLFEGTGAALALSLGSKFPEIEEAASKRARKAALGAAAGTALFVVLAVFPAIAWRLRHGVWLD